MIVQPPQAHIHGKYYNNITVSLDLLRVFIDVINFIGIVQLIPCDKHTYLYPLATFVFKISLSGPTDFIEPRLTIYFVLHPSPVR